MPLRVSKRRGGLLALVVAVLCSGLLGCDGLGYTPSGEHFVEVEPPTGEGVTLELVGSDEVLVARGRVVLEYRLELGGWYINEIVVAAEPEEGAEIPLGSTHDYEQFVFDSRELENGRYMLHLRVRTNSGSGSLADVLGAEQLILTLSQPISVENGTPAVAFTNVARVDGRVVVEWEPSRRVGFEYYELKRIYWSGSSWYDVLGPTRITNREATRFEDRAFVGGRVRYELTVGASGEDPHYTTIEHAEPPPQPLAISQPDGVFLEWSPTPYSANFSRYRLQRRRIPYGSPEPVATYYSPDETTHLDAEPRAFGSISEYALHTESEEVAAPAEKVYGWTGNRVEVGEAEGSTPPDRVEMRAHLPTVNAYLADVDDADYHGPTRSVLIDASTSAVRAVLDQAYQYTVSPDGRRLFAYDGAVLRELDPQTLEPIRSVDLAALFGPMDWVYGLIATDVGLVCGKFLSELACVDMESGAVVRRDAADLYYFVAVSPDGRHAVWDADEPQLVRITPAGFEPVARVSDWSLGEGTFARFLDNERFAFVRYSFAVVQDAETGAVLQQTPLPERFEVTGYDPDRDVLTGFSTEFDLPLLLAFDAMTGEERFRLESGTRAPRSFRFAGDRAWVDGFYREIDG